VHEYFYSHRIGSTLNNQLVNAVSKPHAEPRKGYWPPTKSIQLNCLHPT